jgi:hypothetical protein
MIDELLKIRHLYVKWVQSLLVLGIQGVVAQGISQYAMRNYLNLDSHESWHSFTFQKIDHTFDKIIVLHYKLFTVLLLLPEKGKDK